MTSITRPSLRTAMTVLRCTGLFTALLASSALHAVPLPTVSLTAPVADTVYTAPATVVLSANAASNSSQMITKVEFYRGTTLIGTDTSPPYSFTWSNVPPGSYSLTAKVTVSGGGSATSAARAILVNDPPTISLTTPSHGQLYTTPADVTLNATASDSDGTITKVEFYEGANLLATKTSPPYTHTWANVPVGSYNLTAKATDDKGASTTTPIKTITVQANQPPTISLNTPTNNQSVEVGTSISFTATTTDPENQIARVDYLANGQIVASSYTAPYSASWTPTNPGTVQITATVIDNVGQGATTAPISLTVTTAQPKIRYVHTDHLGTPRTITDQNNSTIWRNLPTTEPFGTAAPEEDPDQDGTPYTFNLRFPGQYHDKETNLSYNYFRDYSPDIGRYIQSDPIGLAGGINTYSYVGGNPLSSVDPEGLANTGWQPSPDLFKGAKIKRTAMDECFEKCMSDNGAWYVVGAATGVMPTTSVPYPGNKTIMGSSNPYTSPASSALRSSGYSGAARSIRPLTPASTLIAVGSTSYLVTLFANCAYRCMDEDSCKAK